MTAEHLRCEYLENPIGIGETAPRLGWWCKSSVRDDKQTAYQILVASSETALARDNGDLWDTGKVASSESSHIEYAGGPLRSRAQAFWKVRVWDKHGEPSAYSDSAHWEVGLLNNSDWKAKWIGMPLPTRVDPSLHTADWQWFAGDDPAKPATDVDRYFRWTFEISSMSMLESAAFWVAIDDSLTATLNGQPVGSAKDWAVISVIDLLPGLREGQNVLAVKAHNNQGPAGMASLIWLAKKDGQTTELHPDWRSTDEAPGGWEAPEFDDSAWPKAKKLAAIDASPWREPKPVSPSAPAPFIRKGFSIEKRVKRARVFASARGLYNLFLDGERVGRDVFNPGGRTTTSESTIRALM